MLHEKAAVFARVMGDLDGARRHAEAVVASLMTLDEEQRSLALAYARLAVLEIEAGEIENARERIQRLREVRESVNSELFSRLRLEDQVEAYLTYWESGDVGPLRDIGFDPPSETEVVWVWTKRGVASEESIDSPSLPNIRRAIFPSWIRHVKTGREGLHRAARWGPRMNRYHCRIHKLTWIHAWDLQTARELGDEEWAGEVETVLDRFRKAALRRELVLELAVAGTS